MLGYVAQAVFEVEPGLLLAVAGAVFAAGSAVGGWVAYIAASRRFRREVKEELGELKHTGGPTVREKMRSIEERQDRFERYFEMLMPRALEQHGVLKVRHRDEFRDEDEEEKR